VELIAVRSGFADHKSTKVIRNDAYDQPASHNRADRLPLGCFSPGTAELGGAEGRQDNGKPVSFRGVEAEVLHDSI